MTVLASPELPMLLEEVEVISVERISPTFVRVELGSPALADFGVGGPTYDQRIKLVFPPEGRRPAPLAGVTPEWMRSTWFALPAQERGHMRTYTVREVRGSGVDTRLVVDLVLHGVDGHGEAGPGSSWAAAAIPGSRITILAPRAGHHFGGIEWVPGAASRSVLAADETAVPAAAAILEQLPAHARGTAYLEVPDAGDALPITHPEGVSVNWLVRRDRAHGERLHAAVVEDAGVAGAPAVPLSAPEEEIDPNLWETPQYSSSGEEVAPAELPAGETYYWIAGESKVVTGLRRVLVKELGVDRSQVSFMGYWRRGVAMKS